MAEENKKPFSPAVAAQAKLSETDLHSIYRTSKKTIQEYVKEIERHNRYKSARSDLANGLIMDNRAALIDLYEACLQQDPHMRGVIETLESQVLGERYMLARETATGQFVKDIPNTKKIQGTQFTKIIRGILEAKLFGYTLIELGPKVNPLTGRLDSVKLVERRNVLPDQNYVVKRQGFFLPGWDIKAKQYEGNYVLINNGDLGMFSATTPMILAKKFTFANYVSFGQTYGQPIIQGKTPDEDVVARKQLADEIAGAAAQRIIVTGLNDELSVHALAMSNSEKIYTSLIAMANAEISNLVLGSESMAGATQSYVGSTNAHQDIFRDRIEVYREYIEDIMNEEIIPRLVKRGMIDQDLQFKFSNKLEMNNADQIKLFEMLTDKFEVDPGEIEKQFGVTVGGQINLIEKQNQVAAQTTAKVNFLTGK